MVSGIPPALADVPIGSPPIDGARQIALDVHRGTGHWFAAVRIHNDNVTTMNMSTDGGATWSQTSWISWYAPVGDIDMVVAGDYVYVAHFLSGFGGAYLGRYDVSTGWWDTVYAHQLVAGNAVVDVALASDQDGADNEIYYALIGIDGSLRFFYDSSADGTTFEELSPPISNASCCLDMTFNPGSADHDVFFSYFDTADTLRIWRSYPWEQVFSSIPWLAYDNATGISAYGDTVVQCKMDNVADGRVVVVYRSYDAGTSWYGDEVEDPGPGEGDYYGCDVTARGGQGFAITYTHEAGDFDPVYLRRHTGSPAEPWGERVVINETDAVAISYAKTTLNWLPPASYGVAYTASSAYPYFDRFDILPFSDGFEFGNTASWSATVP
jgi:hypothetical protein